VRRIPTTFFQTIAILAVLLILAFALSWASPGDAVARSMFQSPLPTDTATLTVPVPPTPQASSVPATLVPPPPTSDGQAPVPTLPPTSPTNPPGAATPPAVPAGRLTPNAAGFLPPPTFSAPGSALATLLPGPQQPLVAPAIPTSEPAGTATDDPNSGGVPGVAQLIDNGVMALSYVWLCCGILVLLGATLILVWLARRSRRS
jgi:hypothetical protein